MGQTLPLAWVAEVVVLFPLILRYFSFCEQRGLIINERPSSSKSATRKHMVDSHDVQCGGTSPTQSMRLAGKMSKRVSVIVKTTCQTTSRSTPAGEPYPTRSVPKSPLRSGVTPRHQAESRSRSSVVTSIQRLNPIRSAASGLLHFSVPVSIGRRTFQRFVILSYRRQGNCSSVAIARSAARSFTLKRQNRTTVIIWLLSIALSG